MHAFDKLVICALPVSECYVHTHTHTLDRWSRTESPGQQGHDAET